MITATHKHRVIKAPIIFLNSDLANTSYWRWIWINSLFVSVHKNSFRLIQIYIALVGVILMSCETNPLVPTYKETFLENEEEVADFFENKFPEVDLIALDSGWIFLKIDSLPGIDRVWPGSFKETTPVSLPHRLPYPNHSIWYQWEGVLEPGILLIRADDGAQCRINGKRILRAAGGDYFVQEVDGKCTLEIRVVNNAMGGGLRQVHLLPQAAFEAWGKKKMHQQENVLTRRKLELLMDSSFRNALKDVPFEEQAKELRNYPILFSPPVVILGSDGKPFVRWVSESAGTAVLHLDTGKKLESFSSDGIFTINVDSATSISFDLYQGKSYQGTYNLETSDFSDGMKLALWGDSQGGWQTFRQIADAIRLHDADLSVGAGDLVNNGSEDWAYPRFMQLLSRMRTTQLLVPGNHDYDGYYDDLYAKQMNDYLFQPEKPTYGIQTFGIVSLITLDPNENFPVSVPEDTPQGEWLERQMASEAWKNSRWRILAVHQPPYSQGWPGYHGEWTIRQLIAPYLHKGLVDLVVAGHTHDYERLSLTFSGNPVHFLVVGGAGGGLEPADEQSDQPQMDKLIKKHHFGILDIDSSQMHFTAYDLNGDLMDELTIRK